MKAVRVWLFAAAFGVGLCHAQTPLRLIVGFAKLAICPSSVVSVLSKKR